MGGSLTVCLLLCLVVVLLNSRRCDETMERGASKYRKSQPRFSWYEPIIFLVSNEVIIVSCRLWDSAGYNSGRRVIGFRGICLCLHVTHCSQQDLDNSLALSSEYPGFILKLLGQNKPCFNEQA